MPHRLSKYTDTRSIVFALVRTVGHSRLTINSPHKSQTDPMDAPERQCLLAKDSDDEDGPRGFWTAFVTTRARSPTRRGSCPRAYASLRSDVWTLLHYRTSLKERSGLHRASYVLEIGVLVLITLNVALAMYVSASPLGPASTLTGHARAGAPRAADVAGTIGHVKTMRCVDAYD